MQIVHKPCQKVNVNIFPKQILSDFLTRRLPDLNKKRPIQQKQNREYHTGNAVGGHKSKVYAAKVVRFNQHMLIDKHGAEKNNAYIIQYANVGVKYRHHNK